MIIARVVIFHELYFPFKMIPDFLNQEPTPMPRIIEDGDRDCESLTNSLNMSGNMPNNCDMNLEIGSNDTLLLDIRGRSFWKKFGKKSPSETQ